MDCTGNPCNFLVTRTREQDGCWQQQQQQQQRQQQRQPKTKQNNVKVSWLTQTRFLIRHENSILILKEGLVSNLIETSVPALPRRPGS